MLWAARRLHVAEDFGFVSILPLVFVAFLVNAWLPLALRPTAFLVASLAALVVVLGAANAAWLFAIGTALVGICHLPLAFRVRVAIVILATAGLASARASENPAPIPGVILPILGSMFMFRMILYLLHLKQRNAPASIATRLGYFFLLPNVCFPFFPIVDYDAFRRRYYDLDADTIYQKGAHWIARGVSHIVLYRLVHQHFARSPENVSDLAGFVTFAVTSYLLYLRISGQFHIAIGILALFGFNLPPTHNLFFMADGFNDLWRRANVYWKDFLLKTIYYPMALHLRSMGPLASAVAPIPVVVGATWLLHSYQWFWLRGTFPVTAVDGLFWGALGVALVVNTRWEAGRRRVGSLSSGPPSWNVLAGRSARAVGVFLTMSLLWSLLCSATVEDWMATIATARNWDGAELALVTGAMALLFAAFFVVQLSLGSSRPISPSFGRSVSATLVLSTMLLALSAAKQLDLPSSALEWVRSLDRDRLNQRDVDLMERGYYEQIQAMDHYLAQLWQPELQTPRGWIDRWRELLVRRGLEVRLRPRRVGRIQGVTITTNEWGMRDRSYALVPAEGTLRYALLGHSTDFGSGVDDDEVYENIVEDRLNRERPFAGVDRYEILNFSVRGQLLLGKLAALPRVGRFAPQAVIVTSIGPDEPRKVVQQLAEAIERRHPIPFPEIRDLAAATGVRRNMAPVEIRRRLATVATETTRKLYEDLVSGIRRMGALPVWMCVPRIGDPIDPAAMREIVALAEGAGFTILSPSGLWEEHEATGLRVEAWDGHPNRRGHEILADELHRALLALGPIPKATGETPPGEGR